MPYGRRGVAAVALAALFLGGCEDVTFDSLFDSWQRAKERKALEEEKQRLLVERVVLAAELAKNTTPPALLPQAERNRLGSLDLRLSSVEGRLESIEWELRELK